MMRWIVLLALLVTGCGSPLGRVGASHLPVSAVSSRVMNGYMPFLWAFADGAVGLAVERIEGERRTVVISRSPDGRRWDQAQALLPQEPFVSHPSAVTLANGETLMHVIVKRQGRFRIAQIAQPLTSPNTELLALGGAGDDVAPFCLRVDRTLYLTWTRQSGGSSQILMASSADQGRTWRPLAPLAHGQLSRMTAMADGKLLVTYQVATADRPGLRLRALSVDPRRNQVGKPEVLTQSGDCHDSFPVFSAGMVTCVFIGSEGGPYALYETQSADGKHWSKPQPLSENGQMNVEPHLLMRADGRGLLAWGVGQSAEGPYQIHLRAYPR